MALTYEEAAAKASELAGNGSSGQLVKQSKSINGYTATDHERAIAKKRRVEAERDYGRGKKQELKRIKDKKLRGELAVQERKFKSAALQAKDAEILLENQSGFLEPEHELEKTWRTRQEDIRQDLDIQTARKGFELKLTDLGPYILDYSRNGRDLLLAGRKGHIATIDWRDGRLGCEIQLGESVRDVKWLHNHDSFAVAQKQNVYIYDRQGVELHKLPQHIDPKFLEFLPYHFLLASIGNSGYLKYTDTSTGQMIIEMPTKLGSPCALRQNPWNAILHTGHQNGTVGLWSPNSTTPLVKLLTHRGPVRSLSTDREGRYMITTGQDSKMAVWDIRMYKEVHNYALPRPGGTVDVSDQGLVAVGWGTQTSIWKGVFDKSIEDQQKVTRPYMTWGGEGQSIERVKWCPFEDVLGITHDSGFSSIIVPGAGEPNFDAKEVNPYETLKQRREGEVRSLLNKLQPEMISLNPDFVGNIDLRSAAERQKEKGFDRKVEDPLEKLKNRSRGRNSALRKYLRKKNSRYIIDEKRLRLEAMLKEQKSKDQSSLQSQKEAYGPALARFARKPT